MFDAEYPSPRPAANRRLIVRVVAVIAAIPLLGIGAAFCAASLARARMSGNEASAIGSLRAIASAQATFAANNCNGRYAPTLLTLGASGALSPDLGYSGTVEKSGYRVTIAAPPGDAATPELSPDCAGTTSAYTATAIPIEPGTTGRRFFRVDENFQMSEATTSSFADASPVQ